MQLALAPVSLDRTATQRLITDLMMDLTRSDAELTNAAHQGSKVGTGWDTWFAKVADRMMDARDAYALLVPNNTGLIAALRRDALDLAASGGQLLSAHANGNTFGSGWSTTLDRKIGDLQAALNTL